MGLYYLYNSLLHAPPSLRKREGRPPALKLAAMQSKDTTRQTLGMSCLFLYQLPVATSYEATLERRYRRMQRETSHVGPKARPYKHKYDSLSPHSLERRKERVALSAGSGKTFVARFSKYCATDAMFSSFKTPKAMLLNANIQRK
jgi:hypothetical protein